MKKFLIQIMFFSTLTALSLAMVLSLEDGHTDPFYIRFTTPRQNNLIIGTSRAAQGLQPSVFQEVLNMNIHNYSFTKLNSPFGRVYLESIKRKLVTNTSNGIFIVTVGPWSISSFSDNPNDSTMFRENNLFLAKTKVVNINPNPFYLLNDLDHKYKTLFFKRRSPMYLHDDGWLEVTINMDSLAVEERLEKKILFYKTNTLTLSKLSSLRLHYLIKTINYLNHYGEVYLVRLPLHPKMMEIETLYMPKFDSIIQEAKDISTGYLDLTEYNSEFIYTDGNHLYKESGKKVSKMIAEWIYDRRQNNNE
ncbi:MAG: hypothetical protein P9X26_07495 [Candidatus Stygibacter frigidus]|nr:hypothetical protein [Candidatus Stygibacter frigidus]